MSTNFTNKREVREAIKSHLQLFVEKNMIENEDMRELIKSVSDAIEVPVAASDVEQQTLESLLRTVESMPHVLPEHLKEVKECLARVQQTPLPPTVPEPSSSKDGTAPTAGDKPSLNLGDFKARMAKKREEIEKRRRDSVPATTTASIAVSGKNSVVTSPGLVSADAPSAVPPTLELEDTHSSKADKKSVGEAPAAPPQPEKKVRVEAVQAPLTLSVALSETEEDLYGDLAARGPSNPVDTYKPYNQNNYYQSSSYRGRGGGGSYANNNNYYAERRTYASNVPPQQHQHQHQQQGMGGYPEHNVPAPPYRNDRRYPPSPYPHHNMHGNYYQ